MQACVNDRFVAVLLAAACSVAQAGVGAAEPTCQLPLTMPASIELALDPDAVEPQCNWLQVNSAAQPFVNGITTVPWATIAGQRGGATANELSFFKVLPGQRLGFSGRKTYAHAQSSYSQTVIGKPKVRQHQTGGRTTIAARTQVRVTWLQPTSKRNMEEVTERFHCVDAAVSDAHALVLINWCEKNGSPHLLHVVKAIHGATRD